MKPLYFVKTIIILMTFIMLLFLMNEGSDFRHKISVLENKTMFMPTYVFSTNFQPVGIIYTNYPR